MIMSYTVRRAKYYYTKVTDEPGEAYRVLSRLVKRGINLLAFTALPVGPRHTQLTMFPEDIHKMVNNAKRIGLKLNGPYHALLVQGDDELGALADIHVKLFEANINVSTASGVSDGKGSYGYIIYVRSQDYEKAVKTLGA